MPVHRTSRTCELVRTCPVITRGVILILTLLFLAGPVSGTVFLINGSEINGTDQVKAIIPDQDSITGNFSITFFYNNQCGACHLAMAYLSEYTAAHPDVGINFIDILNNSQNRALFEEYKITYHRQHVAVPVVFIGNAGLEGEGAIREYFKPLASLYQEKNTGSRYETPVSGNTKQPFGTVISIPLVLLAGMIDGINPCSSSVIILLLACLMRVRERSRVFSYGIIFAGSLFFFYILNGAGILSFSKSSEFVTWFSYAIGMAAVIAGIIFIMKAVFPIPCWAMSRPAENGIVSGFIKKHALLLLCFLGFSAGIIEIPCTGSVYATILDLISFRVHMEQGFVYLFLYNLAVIIPLMVITLLVCLAIPGNETGDEQKTRRFGFTFFTGILLLVFAFLVLSGVL